MLLSAKAWFESNDHLDVRTEAGLIVATRHRSFILATPGSAQFPDTRP